MPIQYDDLESALQDASIGMGAAEVHGSLCGCLAVPESGAESRWMLEIFSGTDKNQAVENCREALSELYRDTLTELHDESLGFHLLLPSDETALGLRVEALGQWCYGFSTGLVLSGLTPERLSRLSEQVREFLGDVSQIAQVSPEMVAYDESEADYAELTEYVRMGVVLLFEELQPGTPLPGLH